MFYVLFHTTKTALNSYHGLKATNTSIVVQKNLESQKNVINLHITRIQNTRWLVYNCD